MKIGDLIPVEETYRSLEADCLQSVRIQVRCSLALENTSKKEAHIGITGEGVKQTPAACIYIGIVIAPIKGFILGSNVVAFGISDAGSDAKVIEANSKVVAVIPHGVSDQTVILSGYAARWINMLKQAKPQLGSVLRVGGKDSKAVCALLSHLGYQIAENDRKADYFFPTDETATGQATHMIEWDPEYGADWNDERLFSEHFVFPPAYINNCVLNNLKTFWDITKGFAFDPSLWPLDRIKKTEGTAVDVGKAVSYLSDDAKYLDKLGKAIPDVVNRKKPVTVFKICGNGQNNLSKSDSIREVLAWVGSVPVRVTKGSEGRFVTICFADGSVATVQFLDDTAADHAQLHFDGKSVFIDGDEVKTFDCTEVGEFMPDLGEGTDVKTERRKVIELYEQQ